MKQKMIQKMQVELDRLKENITDLKKHASKPQPAVAVRKSKGGKSSRDSSLESDDRSRYSKQSKQDSRRGDRVVVKEYNKQISMIEKEDGSVDFRMKQAKIRKVEVDNEPSPKGAKETSGEKEKSTPRKESESPIRIISLEPKKVESKVKVSVFDTLEQFKNARL